MVVIHLFRAEDLVELIQQTRATRLDTEDIIHLVNVIREGASAVQTREHQQVVEVHALGIQHILVLGHIPANHIVVHLLALNLAKVDTAHTVDARQHRIENLVLEESDIGRRLDHGRIKHQTQNQLLCRGVRSQALDNLQLLVVRQLGLNLRQVANVARVHLHIIQLQTHNPRRAAIRLVLQAELAVQLQSIAVLLHNRAGSNRVRVIVHANRLGNVTQSRTLNALHHGNRVIARHIARKVRRVARTLRVRRCRQQLLDTRHTRRCIGLGRTCRVEGIERKLRRRLTDGLGRQGTHHFACMNHRLQVPEANVDHHLIEQHLRETVNQNRLLGSQVVPKQCVEQLVGRELVHKGTDARHHMLGRQVRLGRIPIRIGGHQTLQIHRGQYLVVLAEAEHVPHQHVAVRQNLVHHVRCRRNLRLHEGVDIRGTHSVVAVHILHGHGTKLAHLPLDGNGVNSILTVCELDDRARHITHRAIILHVLVLHRLHQTTLDISRIGGLDGRINQTLTSCLGVEEELRRQKAIHEGTLNESTRLHAIVVAGKVGKRAVLQRVLNTLALNQLLSKQSHHLGNVLRTAL